MGWLQRVGKALGHLLGRGAPDDVYSRPKFAVPTNEAEWHACGDPWPMLECLTAQKKLSSRKLRLFGCACCRSIWSRIPDGGSKRTVEVAEAYADGNATREDVRAVRQM